MSASLTIEELGRRDTTLGLVLNSVYDGVYIVDRKRRIVFWNKGAETITGYSAAEVEGRRCSDNILNHIDVEGNLMCRGGSCPLLRTMRTGQEIEEKVYPLHKSGRRIPTLTHTAPLRNNKGKIIAGIEIFRDISTEEDFRHLQEKFNTLIKKYVSTVTFEETMAQASVGAETVSRRRELTVMFLDIVGFTTFSETRAPEEVVMMLNEVFGICEVITRECHGDIDKYIGDSVMTVFVDANDGVAAAEKILYVALPCMNAVRQEQGQEAVQIRIGMNSGLVVQGDIGSSERKDFTVIGDVVNTAARIQGIIKPDTIGISEMTYSRLDPDNAVRCSFLQKISVKGRKSPVPVFQYQ